MQSQDGYWFVGVANTAETAMGAHSLELWPIADFVRVCGLTVEACQHPYQLLLALHDIEHRTTKSARPAPTASSSA